MRVKVIAQTTFHDVDAELMGYTSHLMDDEYADEDDPNVGDADELAECAGRLCYLSFDRPNPKTATSKGYLANILEQKHYSVLEHASVTFWIEGVSRSLTHELVRHRHGSFSQVSQRYVDESDADFVLPNGWQLLGTPEKQSIINLFEQAKKLYGALYDELTLRGFSKKEARGAARSVLPNMTKTSIILTGNHRMFREFLQKRMSLAADPEIRELAVKIYDQLVELAPNTYQDFVRLEW